MSQSLPIPKNKSEPALDAASFPDGLARTATNDSTSSLGLSSPSDLKTPSRGPSAPSSPSLGAAMSRNSSFVRSNSFQDDWDPFPPLENLTVFDLLDNLALPQRLEKIQNAFSSHTEKVLRHRQRIKATGLNAKDRVVEEWRRRLPTPDEQLDKYRRKMKDGVDRLGKRWSDTKTVTTLEKVSFIAGVLNIFISGFLIGGYPELMIYWYTAQMCYFMPIRYYTYHKRGYHYFLADLCYFVNLLALLSIWAFPRSKRLFISTYCLAYGNNAVAIAMWRNSMVFHSLDKVTSLFIHIMPPVTLHCLVHLLSAQVQEARYPAIYAIKYSLPTDKEHYTLWAMMLWATVPYALWQLSYHFIITVRRREKIAAGRPTSFTWLRRSYSKTWIGRFVLWLPAILQEPAFMLIQYSYAVITMLPCPIWFWHCRLSAIFLMVVFAWSVYNGATFYIDVFGKRFQSELEQLKKDVAKWQNSPDLATSPMLTPRHEVAVQSEATTPLPLSIGQAASMEGMFAGGHKRTSSMEQMSLLDSREDHASGVDDGAVDVVRNRK
ncbi:MAG: hypothetical protein M1817_001518 [Caeruleum heppii]|nr:MAG: hypothetical protein M1817_001518 [Caeruleum heppii]